MNYFLTIGLVLFIYMNLWFVISLLIKRNDFIDVGWGLGFVLVSWVSFFISPNYSTQSLIVSTLVSIWGIRLSWHIFNRNRRKNEDDRYKQWRQLWGKWFYLRSYFQIYFLQGVFLYVISLPVLFINMTLSDNLNMFTYLGIFIWIVGFLFESIADWQLSKFIKEPSTKGKLMTSGLWRYSRHPNYFGEVVQWWGIWIMCIPFALGWLTVLGPITITFLILKVSGIPMLEKKTEHYKDFAKYKKSTSIFFPWPVKK